jgi:dCTP deaminase
MRSTTNSAPTTEFHALTEAEQAAEKLAALPDGVLPSQRLREAERAGWISSGEFKIDAFQPASIDLRLGEYAWPLRCSFLPDSKSSVEGKLDGIAFPKIDLRDGTTLERNRPYLIPLIEELNLPPWVRGKTNPKSSTGRLDVFTRVITDNNNRFDEIPQGYHGKLYLEVVPRSFAIQVKDRASLNQLRLMKGKTKLTDADLLEIHREYPLAYSDTHALRESELALSGGLFLSVDLAGDTERLVGYRAQRTSLPLSVSRTHAYHWRKYWEPVYPEPGGRVVLLPEEFYLLLSAEGVCIPPRCAAEMMAYDPTAGELRTHYAGFFDPGFGLDQKHGEHGTQAALEVRARDVPFMVEHGQPICKLAFEGMAETPNVLYGEDNLRSNYQGQSTMLGKHFVEQGPADPHLDVGIADET